MKRRFLLAIYLRGYAAKPLPRRVRRCLARTAIHRAWLSGYNGHFEEGDRHYGLTSHRRLRPRP